MYNVLVVENDVFIALRIGFDKKLILIDDGPVIIVIKYYRMCHNHKT